MNHNAEQLAQQESVIRRYGWSMQHVTADLVEERPSFSYTIGLHDQGYPELLLVGVPVTYARLLMNDTVAAMKAQPSADQFRGKISLENWELPFYILEPDMEQVATEYATFAAKRSAGKAKYLHICLPDAYGIFPWQPGFDRQLEHVVFLLGPAPRLN
ncbi:DUF4262 domain-containing protein [Achromobacter xylosoxidans]